MAKKTTRIDRKGAAKIRCAIYTRKSSEEGLEQDFNSLDAQREACEAYIASQKSSGWITLPDLYDDGGISGGTLARQALKRLLADIEADRVDTVVVYKVDRLTRALNDFAKIVDAFDAKGVSFVSVTQQFNTTTSMGRLTLNMLLSFAQFEREVTSERIRDKIAASKQKGMWMGGLPPLGYDVDDRKLVVNALEADTVRHIFQRYVAVKSVLALAQELDREGIVSKARLDRHGVATGAKPLARGALYLMLQNRIYRGEIVHKDKSYPGLHDAIINKALWDNVQAALSENRIERTARSKAADPSLLTGLVFDANGERMSPTHANKKGTRYRYYVSQSLIKRSRPRASDAARRVPAADLEAIVQDSIRGLLIDEFAILETVDTTTVNASKARIENAARLARQLLELTSSDKRLLLVALIGRIDVGADTIDIAVRPIAVTNVIEPDVDFRRLPTSLGPATKLLSVPARVKRTGMATKLLIQGSTGPLRREPDRSLIRLIAQARRINTLVMSEAGSSITVLAAKAGVSRSYFTRVLRLSFLDPKITAAILDGRQPPELTANKLMLTGQLERMWPNQLRQLGFDQTSS